MDPISLMLLSQLAPAAINLTKAGVQGYKANQLGKTPRPTYEIPQAIQEATNSARYQAGMTRLPGQNIMEDRLGRTTSNALGDLKEVSNSPSQLGANIAKVYGNQMNAENTLGIQAGQNWQNNQGLLRSQLGQLGRYQDYQFDYNQNQPYQAKMAASSALREGAFRNLSAGVGDISKTGTALAAYLAAKKASEDDGTNGVEDARKNTMDMNMALSMGGDGASEDVQSIDSGAMDDLTNTYGANYKQTNSGFDYQYPPQTGTGDSPNLLALLELYKRMNK